MLLLLRLIIVFIISFTTLSSQLLLTLLYSKALHIYSLKLPLFIISYCIYYSFIFTWENLLYDEEINLVFYELISKSILFFYDLH